MLSTIYTFKSGLKLAHIQNTSVRSVALGVHFGVGSGNETPEINGISHFIEHMMFKGTEKRSALDIVEELEGNGINVNAFTSKLSTCYYTISIDEDVEKCFDVLSDILLHSQFSEEEMKREKGVILEEISISEDDPQDLCLDNLATAYYGDHPLGMTILGSRSNVSGFTREEVLDYYNKNYVANNCCIAVSGNISFDKAKKLVEKYFEGKLKSNYDIDWRDKACVTASNYISKVKDVEQANIGIAFKSYTGLDDKQMEVEIISSVLGGGMSSRLFQIIREQLGLAYSVYTYQSRTINNGYFVISLSTNRDSLEKALRATKEEIDRFKTNGMTKEEFERAKKLTLSGYIISAESTSALMRIIGKKGVLENKTFDIDDYINRINAVTLEDVQNCIKEIFNYDNMSMSYVGREIEFNALDLFKE